jgi:hypothetical protein
VGLCPPALLRLVLVRCWLVVDCLPAGSFGN